MYDFVSLPSGDRSGSFKYRDMYKRNPRVPAGIVPLSVADMEFSTAPEIREGLGRYLAENTVGYSDITDDFKEALISWMRRRHNYAVEKEWIAPSDGVVTAIGDLIESTTEPGDGVIVFSPVYNPFKKSVKMKGRKLVEISLKERADTYEIDFDAFEREAQNSEAKLLIFCNPHNPVGKVWSKEDLRKVYDICFDNGLFIIDDEIHHDLIMPGYEHTVMANVADGAGMHMAVCTAPSKSFNLAGLQTSSIIIQNSKVREAFNRSRMKGFRSFTNVIGAEACRIAYNECERWLDECINVICDNAKYIQEFFAVNMPEVKVYPLEGTYLLWCDFRAFRLSDKELEAFMTDKAYIFADEGYIFGQEGSGFERINLACPKHVICETMERLLIARNEELQKERI